MLAASRKRMRRALLFAAFLVPSALWMDKDLSQLILKHVRVQGT